MIVPSPEVIISGHGMIYMNKVMEICGQNNLPAVPQCSIYVRLTSHHRPLRDVQSVFLDVLVAMFARHPKRQKRNHTVGPRDGTYCGEDPTKHDIEDEQKRKCKEICTGCIRLPVRVQQNIARSVFVLYRKSSWNRNMEKHFSAWTMFTDLLGTLLAKELQRTVGRQVQPVLRASWRLLAEVLRLWME